MLLYLFRIWKKTVANSLIRVSRRRQKELTAVIWKFGFLFAKNIICRAMKLTVRSAVGSSDGSAETPNSTAKKQAKYWRLRWPMQWQSATILIEKATRRWRRQSKAWKLNDRWNPSQRDPSAESWCTFSKGICLDSECTEINCTARCTQRRLPRWWGPLN